MSSGGCDTDVVTLTQPTNHIDVAMLIQISKCIVHSQCQYVIDENGFNQAEMQKQVGRILHYEIAFSGSKFAFFARRRPTMVGGAGPRSARDTELDALQCVNTM